MIYADFTILQKGCHASVNIITLNDVYECCHTVVEMFSYNVCSNIMATFLKLSWNMLQQHKCANVFTTFPQRCGSVAATIYC